MSKEIEIYPGWLVLDSIAFNVNKITSVTRVTDTETLIDQTKTPYAFEDVIYAVTEAFALTLPGDDSEGSCGCEDEGEDEDE